MSEFYEFEYLASDNILIGRLLAGSIDRDMASEIYDHVDVEINNQPDYDHFILDVRKVVKVTNHGIGFLMKSLGIIKKTRGYMILVMTEELLQEIMLIHPEMFDFYAVFHTLEEAIAFAKK